jgi:hypothetical protein
VEPDLAWVERLLSATERALTDLRALEQQANPQLRRDLEQLRDELAATLAAATRPAAQ